MAAILIAYERETERNAIERVLIERGHTVARSSNGVDALELARRESPTLAVSDILLPTMDGFALCKKWKQDERLQHVPFIFYTRPHNDPKYERFALEVGADRYLERSNDPQALIKVVDEVLAQLAATPHIDTTLLESTQGGWLTNTGLLRTGAFARTGMFAAAKLVPVPTPAAPNGIGKPAGSSLAREQRLLARINEVEALNKTLQTSEARLRNALEATERTHALMADAYKSLVIAAADGYLLLDESDRVIDANEAYCAMSGYRKDELLKLAASDLEANSQASQFQRIKDGATQTSRYEARLRRKQGAEFLAEISIGVLSGARARTVLIVRDSSEREHVQAQLQCQQRMELLAMEAANEIYSQAEALDENALARRATELAASLSDSPTAYFCVGEQDRAKLVAVFETASNAALSLDDAESELSATGAIAQALRSGRALLSNDATVSESHISLPKQERALLVPVVNGAQVIGLLGVANRSAAYTQTDQLTLNRLCEALASVLLTKHNERQASNSTKHADERLHSIIEGLSRMVEFHDPYIAGNPRCVSTLAVALASELGMDAAAQNSLQIAGLLHGIGKIVIPSTLLSKPGPLTAAETTLMQTHVEESYKMLLRMHFEDDVAQVVYQHQERLDGSGYPRGLKGEQILPGARVLAVANVVAAICATRSYHPARNLDETLDELLKGRDRLYDRTVVDACVRLFREKQFRLPA